MALAGTTCEILGLSHLGSGRRPPALSAAIARDTVLADIQFRGAISDLHAFRQALVESPCESLVFRINESDTYGDGNNFEVAASAAAVDAWARGSAELERRAAREARKELRRMAEKALPKSRRPHKARASDARYAH